MLTKNIYIASQNFLNITVKKAKGKKNIIYYIYKGIS